MKTLSIKQPWAWLIVHGYKPLENRSWKTKYRGQILIQASLKFDLAGYSWIKNNAERLGIDRNAIPREHMLAYGAIIGKATIADCVTDSDSPWFFGPVGFVLEKAEAFEKPIPCKGRLGFFDVRL